MAIKIIVLDDGDTWAGDGDVFTVTEDAYDRLCNGARIRDLNDYDVLKVTPVYEGEDADVQ